MIDAFPKLRVYCQERGLDFQVNTITLHAILLLDVFRSY